MIVWLVVGRVVVLRECTVCLVVRIRAVVESLLGTWYVEIISKWNNFTTFIAKKPSTVFSAGKDRKPKKNKKTMATPNLDNLFNSSPTYLSNYVDPKKLYDLCQSRIEAFLEKGNLSFKVLQEYDEIAALIQKIPCMRSKRLKFDIDHLVSFFCHTVIILEFIIVNNVFCLPSINFKIRT